MTRYNVSRHNRPVSTLTGQRAIILNECDTEGKNRTSGGVRIPDLLSVIHPLSRLAGAAPDQFGLCRILQEMRFQGRKLQFHILPKAQVELFMPIPTEPGQIAAVLKLHGISLSEAETEALRARLTLDAQLVRSLTEDVDLIRPETMPALRPAWYSGGDRASRSETAASHSPDGEIAPPYPRRYDTPSEAVEAALARIEGNGDKAVFTKVFAEQARADARALEERAGRGQGGVGPDHMPLWGTTVTIKDLMSIKGYRMTGGTTAVTWPEAKQDALIVDRLRRAGAVVIGAVNLHELAFGTTGENPHFGTVANPAAPGRLTGGSSSGSAAAVGFDMSTFSIGTDTGGSIRIPAACCGVVGLKPSFGLVPSDGAFPLGYSLDHLGPLTKSVTEAAVILDVLTGRPGAYSRGIETPLEGLRIGVPREYFPVAQPDVRDAYERALQRAEAAGTRLVPISLPHIERAPAAYLGSSGAEAITIHYHTLVHHGDKLGADVRVRLAAALFIPAYARIKAQQLRTLIFDELAAAFHDVDVIATPSLPIVPPPVGTATVQVQDAEMPTPAAFLRNACPFNLTGLPAISIPNGTDRDGVPIGLQLVGAYNDDAKLLQAARAFERDVLGN